MTNASGDVVFTFTYNTDEGKKTPAPEGILGHFAKGAPMVSHVDPQGLVAGIIVLKRGAMLVASWPIVASYFSIKGRAKASTCLLFGVIASSASKTPPIGVEHPQPIFRNPKCQTVHHASNLSYNAALSRRPSSERRFADLRSGRSVSNGLVRKPP